MQETGVASSLLHNRQPQLPVGYNDRTLCIVCYNKSSRPNVSIYILPKRIITIHFTSSHNLLRFTSSRIITTSPDIGVSLTIDDHSSPAIEYSFIHLLYLRHCDRSLGEREKEILFVNRNSQ